MNSRLYFVLPFILQSTVWRVLIRPFLTVFAHLEVVGYERLKALRGPVVFAPNHSSELDSVLLPLTFPLWSRFAPMFYIVREPSFYKDPVFAWRRHFYSNAPLFAVGAFPIVSGIKDYAVSLARHVKILHDGGSICIFPEGGFTKTGEIGPAHGGVAYLAHAAGCAIVPVLIDGTFKFNLINMFLGKTRITVTFLPPLFPQQVLSQNPSIEEYHSLAQNVLDDLRKERARHSLVINSVAV